MPADDRPPLSCYIRTLNEEVRIGATVRAAFGVAREVVVVDSGSTDGTLAAAEAEGARIIEQAWLGGGHQKRVGEDACRYDWLLNLDADEIISEKLAQQIRGVFTVGEPDADVYILPVVIVDPAGRIWRHARANPRARLYDRRKVRMPAHAVWDQFPIPPGLRTRRLGGFLLHHAFDDLAHLSRKQGSAMVRRVRFLDNERPLSTALRVYFGLPYFFFRSYIIRGRWMEGGYGFLLSMVTAYNHWFKFAMLHEKRLKKQGSKEASDRPG